jgi:ABC-type lipoprotein export system ATPase subunit
MFLAWRELKSARCRCSLMGGVVALIAVLVVLLSGLSSGLVNDGVSGLQRIPATAFAFAGGTKTANGIVVSKTLLDAGVRIGDVITVDRLGTALTVIGATADQHTFGHVDVAYVPLPLWQTLHASAGPHDVVRAGADQEATAVALLAADGRAINLAAAGTTSMTLTASFAASPGFTAETSTLMLIQAFLYAISALVVGAFFTVWTIQRTGELVAVVGPSGAGKSSLLAVAGALTTPDEGTVVIDGVELSSLSAKGRARFRREKIGFVFQSGNLIPALTAIDQLRLAVDISGRRSGGRDPLALLDEVGMAAKVNRRPHELSRGERQRVRIARALVTHDHDVLHHCDRVLEMVDGRLSR